MNPDLVPKLAAILEKYVSNQEFFDLAADFGVEIHPETSSWLSISRATIYGLPVGNTRRFVDSVLEMIEARNVVASARVPIKRRMHICTLPPR